MPRLRLPNPISKRLAFVKSSYDVRPQVYDMVLDTVKRAAKTEQIDPEDTRAWERRIPELASKINRAFKKKESGAITEDGLRQHIFAARKDFLRGVQEKERERAEAEARGRATIERRSEKKRLLQSDAPDGYEILDYKLAGGHIAVLAKPDLKAPPYPRELEAQKRWVADNAPFQHWLGVRMRNCLQFYEVNYVPHGHRKYETQKDGGKLYAVLTPKGEPAAAILTNKDNRLIESNGPSNFAPTGQAMEATSELLGKLEVKFGAQGRAQRFDIPGADPRPRRLVEFFVDRWNDDDLDTRDIWLNRIRVAVTQDGFDFEPALRKFLVHILVGSKYSALASVRKSDYPKKNKVGRIIARVAKLIARNAPENELRAASAAAGYAAVFADAAVFAAARHAAATAAVAYAAVAYDDAAATAYDAARAAAPISYDRAGHARGVAAHSAVLRDYAAALLYFIEQQAQGGNRRRANPSSQNIPSLEAQLGTRSRPSRRSNPTRKPRPKAKTSPAKTLVSECHRLWEHYCERPGKTRLKAVLKHCELMAESSAKSVKEERARCMRAARREMKKLGMK